MCVWLLLKEEKTTEDLSCGQRRYNPALFKGKPWRRSISCQKSFFGHFYPRLSIWSEKLSARLSLWGVVFSEHHAILRLLALYWGGFMCSTSGSIAGRHEDKFMSDHTGELPSLLQTCLECLKLLKKTLKVCERSNRPSKEVMESLCRL